MGQTSKTTTGIMPKTGTKYGYARVSTPDQSDSLDGQAGRLKAAGCSAVFKDVASGKLASRPNWDALMALVESGDTLTAVKLDRVGRSVSNLIALCQELDRRGVILEFLDQSIETRTAQGRMF